MLQDVRRDGRLGVRGVFGVPDSLWVDRGVPFGVPTAVLLVEGVLPGVLL